jgi:hypothetical protein
MFFHDSGIKMDPYMALLEGLQRQDAGEIHGTNEVENHLRLWGENGAKKQGKNVGK